MDTTIEIKTTDDAVEVYMTRGYTTEFIVSYPFMGLGSYDRSTATLLANAAADGARNAASLIDGTLRRDADSWS